MPGSELLFLIIYVFQDVDVDVILVGLPCKDLSTRGRRAGLKRGDVSECCVNVHVLDGFDLATP